MMVESPVHCTGRNPKDRINACFSRRTCVSLHCLKKPQWKHITIAHQENASFGIALIPDLQRLQGQDPGDRCRLCALRAQAQAVPLPLSCYVVGPVHPCPSGRKKCSGSRALLFVCIGPCMATPAWWARSHAALLP
jgi:hypothetical protein